MGLLLIWRLASFRKPIFVHRNKELSSPRYVLSVDKAT